MAGRRGRSGSDFLGFAKIRVFTAVLDDRRARTLAEKNNVSVLGSLRVIVIAKRTRFNFQSQTRAGKITRRRRLSFRRTH